MTAAPQFEAEQPPLETEDWPRPKPGLWPPVMVLGREEQVRAVTTTYTGNVELAAGTPEDVALAEHIELAGTVFLHVEASVQGTSHKLVKGAPHGYATLAVLRAVRADREGALEMAAELESMRRTVHSLRSALREVVSFADPFFDPPREGEPETPGFQAIRHARYQLDATKWVPQPKEGGE